MSLFQHLKIIIFENVYYDGQDPSVLGEEDPNKAVFLLVLWEAQHWPGDEDIGGVVSLDDENTYDVDGVAGVVEELIRSSQSLPVLEQASKDPLVWNNVGR